MTCAARQYSDQMLCGTCGLAWDMNDPDPPPCPHENAKGPGVVSAEVHLDPDPPLGEIFHLVRKYGFGDRLTKTNGSSWTGRVVGFYSTALTPVGYAIESENEPGSVQIYPESALRPAEERLL